MRALGYDAADPEKCGQRNGSLASAVATFRPDVVVVLSCLWDIADRQLPGQSDWLAPGDPTYTAWTAAYLGATADTLGSAGARVQWMTCPHLDPVYHPEVYMGPPPYPVADPARVAWLNDQIRAVTAGRPFVEIVDLAARLAQWPGGDLDPTRRPDGVHLSDQAAIEVAAWLMTARR